MDEFVTLDSDSASIWYSKLFYKKKNAFSKIVIGFENVSHNTIENTMRQIFGQAYFSEISQNFLAIH